MTKANVVKFSIALSAAAAAHLSVLAYTVPHAPLVDKCFPARSPAIGRT